jgi:cyclopropane-fatty-acyl-phospholipid synthase
MVYTCAYFPEPNASLEAAQQAKLDLVCKKLWLQNGERVIEAGCGWGALALYMAAHYGVNVKAFNVCEEQIEVAKDTAKRMGLQRQVEFIHDDYRNIQGKYDVFVSVGMLEHVGKSHYAELGEVINRTIGNAGRGLLHFIGRDSKANLSPWIQKRIFPGGYVPALTEALPLLEKHEFAVLDTENLRLHYARTLEEWLARYEKAFDAVTSRYGRSFARMWRLYLAGSAAAFHTGSLQLFQITFAGSKCAELPWTRAYLYRGERRSGSEQWTAAM